MQEKIVAEARKLLGVKFHHQGRSAVTGLDCLGLLVLVAERVGLEFEGVRASSHDRKDYGHNPDTTALQAGLERFLCRVDEPCVGDVGLFRIDGRPQHLAIISDYPAPDTYGMIHAYAPLKKVVEHRLDEGWQSQLAAMYRFGA